MEGLEKIRQLVLDQAREEAEQILKDARDEAKAILDTAAKEADQMDIALEKKLEEQEQENLARQKSLNAVDQRRIILEEKQRLIEACLEEVKEQMIHLSPECRRDFYIHLLEGIAKDGQTIQFAKHDEAFADEVLTAVPVDLKLGEFLFDEEGGFILREGKVTWRYTFQALIARDEESYVELIAKLLFTDEDGDVAS